MCDILLTITKPSRKTIDSKLIASNEAYVRYENQLYYINKLNNECILLDLTAKQLTEFDQTTQLDQLSPEQSRSLGEKELDQISLITGHASDAIIDEVELKGTDAIMKSFDEFTKEILASLDKDRELVTEPCELMLLGEHFRNTGQYSKAKSSYEEVIPRSSEFNGFAHMYKVFSIVNESSDLAHKLEAIGTLKVAKHHLELMIERLSHYNSIVLNVAERAKIRGKLLEPERSKGHVRGKVAVISAQIGAINAAMGSDLTVQSFNKASLSEGAIKILFENLVKCLKDEKIDDHPILKESRVSKKVSVKEVEGEYRLYREGSQEPISFPPNFADAEQAILTALRDKTKNGDEFRPLEQRFLDFNVLENALFSYDQFIERVKEHFDNVDMIVIDQKQLKAMGQSYLEENEALKPFAAAIKVFLTNADNEKLPEVDFEKNITGYAILESEKYQILKQKLIESKIISIKKGHVLKKESSDKIKNYFAMKREEKEKVKFLNELGLVEENEKRAEKIKSTFLYLLQLKCFDHDDIKSLFQGDKQENLQQLWDALNHQKIIHDRRVYFSLRDDKAADRARNPKKYLNEIKKVLAGKVDKLVEGAPVGSHGLYFDRYELDQTNLGAYYREYFLNNDELYYFPYGALGFQKVNIINPDGLFELRKKHYPGNHYINLTPEQIKTLITDNGGHIPEIKKELYLQCAEEAIETAIGTIKHYDVLALKAKQLKECFDEQTLPIEVDEFIRMGCGDVLCIEQYRSYWDWNAFAAFIIEAFQFVVGFALEMLGFVYIGTALMGDALNGMVSIIQSMATKSFTWAGYGEHKAISLSIALATAGFGKLTADAQQVAPGFTGVTDATKTGAQEFSKAGIFKIASDPIAWKNAGIKAVGKLTVGFGRATVQSGMSRCSSVVIGPIMSRLRDNFKKHMLDDRHYIQVKQEIKKTFEELLIHHGEAHASAMIDAVLQELNLTHDIEASCSNTMIHIGNKVISGLSQHAATAHSSLGPLMEGLGFIADYMLIPALTAANDIAQLATCSLRIFSKFNEDLKRKLTLTLDATTIKRDVTHQESENFCNQKMNKMANKFLDEIEKYATSVLAGHLNIHFDHFVTSKCLFDPIENATSRGLKEYLTVAKMEESLSGERQREQSTYFAKQLKALDSNRLLNGRIMDPDEKLIIGNGGEIKRKHADKLFGETELDVFSFNGNYHLMNMSFDDVLTSHFVKGNEFGQFAFMFCATYSDVSFSLQDEEGNTTLIESIFNDASPQRSVSIKFQHGHWVLNDKNEQGEFIPVETSDGNELHGAQVAYLAHLLHVEKIELGIAKEKIANVNEVKEFIKSVYDAIRQHPTIHAVYVSIINSAPTPEEEATCFNSLSSIQDLIKPPSFNLTIEEKTTRNKLPKPVKPSREPTKSQNKNSDESDADQDFSISLLPLPTIDSFPEMTFTTDAFDEPSEEDLNKQSLVQGVFLEKADALFSAVGASLGHQNGESSLSEPSTVILNAFRGESYQEDSFDYENADAATRSSIALGYTKYGVIHAQAYNRELLFQLGEYVKKYANFLLPTLMIEPKNDFTAYLVRGVSEKTQKRSSSTMGSNILPLLASGSDAIKKWAATPNSLIDHPLFDEMFDTHLHALSPLAKLSPTLLQNSMSTLFNINVLFSAIYPDRVGTCDGMLGRLPYLVDRHMFNKDKRSEEGELAPLMLGTGMIIQSDRMKVIDYLENKSTATRKELLALLDGRQEALRKMIDLGGQKRLLIPVGENQLTLNPKVIANSTKMVPGVGTYRADKRMLHFDLVEENIQAFKENMQPRLKKQGLEAHSISIFPDGSYEVHFKTQASTQSVKYLEERVKVEYGRGDFEKAASFEQQIREKLNISSVAKNEKALTVYLSKPVEPAPVKTVVPRGKDGLPMLDKLPHLISSDTEVIGFFEKRNFSPAKPNELLDVLKSPSNIYNAVKNGKLIRIKDGYILNANLIEKATVHIGGGSFRRDIQELNFKLTKKNLGSFAEVVNGFLQEQGLEARAIHIYKHPNRQPTYEIQFKKIIPTKSIKALEQAFRAYAGKRNFFETAAFIRDEEVAVAFELPKGSLSPARKPSLLAGGVKKIITLHLPKVLTSLACLSMLPTFYSIASEAAETRDGSRAMGRIGEFSMQALMGLAGFLLFSEPCGAGSYLPSSTSRNSVEEVPDLNQQNILPPSTISYAPANNGGSPHFFKPAVETAARKSSEAFLRK